MDFAPSLPQARARWRQRLYPYLLLSLASFLWAGNWIVGRAVRDAMPPVALTFWRWAVAALLLAPVALPRLAGKGALLRRHWQLLFLLGFSGVALFQAFVYTGLRYTTSVNGVLMNSAAPLFIILVARLLDGTRVTLRQLLGVALSFLGILLIMNRGDLANLQRFRFNPGDVIILLGMPAWGVYSVLVRRRPAELDGLALIFVIASIGAAIVAPFYALESVVFAAPRLGWSSAGAVFYIACFASIAAYLCWNRGVELVGPNRAGFTIPLLPAFGTALAMITLGEAVHLYHLVGIATIFAGVWLATSARRALQR
jgi:drug/metabolite transporter (DMT)-like permease